MEVGQKNRVPQKTQQLVKEIDVGGMDGTAGATSGAGQVERPESENSMEGKEKSWKTKGIMLFGGLQPGF
jgi:hypothetical protein